LSDGNGVLSLQFSGLSTPRLVGLELGNGDPVALKWSGNTDGALTLTKRVGNKVEIGVAPIVEGPISLTLQLSKGDASVEAQGTALPVTASGLLSAPDA